MDCFIHEIQIYSSMKFKCFHSWKSNWIMKSFQRPFEIIFDRTKLCKVSLNVPRSHSLFFFYPLHFTVYFTNMYAWIMHTLQICLQYCVKLLFSENKMEIKPTCNNWSNQIWVIFFYDSDSIAVFSWFWLPYFSFAGIKPCSVHTAKVA